MSGAQHDDPSETGRASSDDHDELRALIGGHLLGGAPDGDDQRLRRHLATCPSCRAELAELGAVVDLLPLADSSLGRPAPPSSLRRQVLRAGAEGVHPRRPTSRALVALVAAAAILLLVAAIGGGIGVLRADDSGDDVAVTLRPVDGGPSGRAQLRQGDGSIRIELDVEGLDSPSGRETYELWLVHDDGQVSAGTFRPTPDGKVRVDLTAAGEVGRYARIGVTIEPDDSDPSRNGAPVLEGSVPS